MPRHYRSHGSLKRVAPQRYESPNFLMTDRKIMRGSHWFYRVFPRTPEGETVLRQPTHHMAAHDARVTIAHLEREILHAHDKRPRDILPAPVMDAASFIALREQLFPGVPRMEARKRIATALAMAPSHVRHMEEGNRAITARTTKLLHTYARDILRKSREELAVTAKALAPFKELWAVMAEESTDDTPDTYRERESSQADDHALSENHPI